MLAGAGYAVYRAGEPSSERGTSPPPGPSASTTSAGPSAAGVCTADASFDPGSGVVGSDHRYTVDPPAGGPYAPDSAPPDFYTTSRPPPPDAALVRAMRRGFTVLWYRPDVTAAQLGTLRSLSDEVGRDMILVPRRSLAGPVALTAWHARLHCAQVDAAAVRDFVRARRDRGPEKGYL